MSDAAFADNPWSAEHWNLTRQGQYIKKYGLEVAKTKAKQAGAKIGGPKPTDPLMRTIERHWIIQKKIGAGGGAGGLVGAGSSGSGAP